METGESNKMMTPDTTGGAATNETVKVTKPYVVKTEYFYPDHGVTVQAASQQEADEALAKILANATIKT